MRSILHTLERLFQNAIYLNVYSGERIIFRSIED